MAAPSQSASGAGSNAFHSDFHEVAVLNIATLPVSSYIGPDVSSSLNIVPKSIEEQLAEAQDALTRLAEHRRQQELDSHVRSSWPKTGRGRPHTDRSEKTRPTAALQYLRLLKDPRILELQACVASTEEEEEVKQAEGIYGLPIPEDSPSVLWKRQLKQKLCILLKQIQMCSTSEAIERQLQGTYDWYLTSKPAFVGGKSTRGTNLAGASPHPQTEEVDGQLLPGSAFYVPPSDNLEELPVTIQSSAADQLEEAQQSPFQVTLPPAKDRLRSFETRRIVRPLTARKLVSAGLCDCPSPDLIERPFTPSTATGGFTARSIASARSTPSPTLPGGSRPTSAAGHPFYRRPMTAQSTRSNASDADSYQFQSGLRSGRTSPWERTPRPHSAAPGVGQVVPPLPLPLKTTAQDELPQQMSNFSEPYPSTTAELNMEQRWLAFRHREVSSQVLALEQKQALKAWVERRARVEEEITRNVEASRFQSALRRRGYQAPADAVRDIPATSITGSVGLDSVRLAQEEVTRRREPPRFDVSQPSTLAERETRVSFSSDSSNEGALPELNVTAQRNDVPEKPLSARIGHLRKLHAHLLRFEEKAPTKPKPEDQESDSDEEGTSDFVPGTFFTTALGTKHTSLSAYTCASDEDSGLRGPAAPRREDASDCLLAVCDWWKTQHGIEEPKPGDLTLKEIRFRQLKEVEAIKRVFAGRNCPINAATLERALVMPAHTLKAKFDISLINHTPDLSSTSFPQVLKKAKPKKKKKGAAKAAAKQAAAPGRGGRGRR